MLVRVCINGHPSTLWWGCKLLQPLWRTVWRFLEKLKIELPYDPTVPLLGVYPEKTIIQKDTCTHPNVHNITITIARTWKEPTCPLTDEWIKKMWPVHTHTHTYTHTQEYHLAIIKNEIMLLAATCVDLEIIIVSTVSQRQIS